MRKLVLLLVFWSALLIPSAYSNSETKADSTVVDICISHGGSPWPWSKTLQQRIEDNWSPSEVFGADSWVTIEAQIADDGKMYNLQLTHSSGKPQLDADCLQAVISAQAFKPQQPSEINQGTLRDARWDFNSKTKCGFRSEAIHNYFQLHPEQKRECVAYYRIPLDVLKRYPGAFSENELLAASNILVKHNDRTTAIPEDGSPLGYNDKQLDASTVDYLQRQFLTEWLSFFQHHPTATRSDILRHAQILQPKS